MTVTHFADPETVNSLKTMLTGLWTFAEVFLFTLTGTSLSFKTTNGPLNR